MSASYLDILLDIDIEGKLTTQLCDRRDDISFSIVSFLYLCSDIITKYDMCVSRLVRCARDCSAYDQFLSRSRLFSSSLLLDRTNEDPADTHIKRKAWKWIGHTWRKPYTSITREALDWNP